MWAWCQCIMQKDSVCNLNPDCLVLSSFILFLFPGGKIWGLFCFIVAESETHFCWVLSTFSHVILQFFYSNPPVLSLSFALQGESDDADLSISGGCRLLRVSVLPKSWQQEEAAHPLWLYVQPPLQLRAQEICHCSRPKDICLWCCFHPGCFTSKNHCMFVCVFLKSLLEIQPLKDKGTSLCSQGETRGLEKNASLGSGGIPTDVGLTAGTFRLSEEWFEFSPLMSNLYFHRTANTQHPLRETSLVFCAVFRKLPQFLNEALKSVFINVL